MLHDSTGIQEPFFSHLVRWNNTARIKQFFSKNMQAELKGYSATDELARMLPADFEQRDTLSKAQYLEDKLFLSNYLLTSQGDRMAMAHSVEIRPPYLDFRIIDFMSHVSPRWKILGLDEKHILKKTFGPRAAAVHYEKNEASLSGADPESVCRAARTRPLSGHALGGENQGGRDLRPGKSRQVF